MVNDNSPTTPADNNDTAFNAYDDMVALKRVTSTDITHAVVRRDWASGTTYDEYAHDYSSSNTANSGATSLFAATFYVLTDDYNVYKSSTMMATLQVQLNRLVLQLVISRLQMAMYGNTCTLSLPLMH